MDTNLMKRIKEILKQFPQYWNGEELQRTVVIDDLKRYDAMLISSLLKNKKIKEVYSVQAGDVLIFKVQEFIDLLRYKDYWADSYTKYSNTIGLATEGKYLQYNSDVVLDFPYKDCVLEGGMTKEDVGKEEVFYNNIIARDEIDTLLSPKIFTNVKKYDKNGEHEIDSLSNEDNLIIKGNNLLALHSLKERYAGKVKCIYIDPPYNTGGDSFKYNDRFNHSTWLTFMKNRLEIAKELLREDGAIFIHTDDAEQAYLKVLSDSIFQRKNYVNTISIQFKNTAGASGGGEDKRLKKNVEYLTVFVKNREVHKGFNSIFSLSEIGELVQKYRDENRSWKYTSVLVDEGTKEYLGETKDGAGASIVIYKRVGAKVKSIKSLMIEDNLSETEIYNKYAHSLFRTTNAQTSIRNRIWDKAEELRNDSDIISIEYVPRTGKNKGIVYEQYYKGDKYNLFVWLRDTTENVNGHLVKKDALGTSWDFIAETKNVNKEGSSDFSNGKKPELLISNIIEMSTNEDDIVLDFFMGSATTQAVAMKMNRKFIGIEQMDYIHTVSVPRLQKVIEGEQGGISKDVHWKGGGSFVYAELMEFNQFYIDKIDNALNKEELSSLWTELETNADLNFQLDKERLTNDLLKQRDEESGSISFDDLTFEEQKEIFKQALDKNQLYVPYSEIDDENVVLSENDKAFNRSFYDDGGE